MLDKLKAYIEKRRLRKLRIMIFKRIGNCSSVDFKMITRYIETGEVYYD